MQALAGQLARITAERVQVELTKLLLGSTPRARPGAAGRHRPGRRRAAGAAGPADGRRRARPAQGRLRPHPAGPRPGHRPRGARRRARTWCCAGRRCCTTSASRRPARSCPVAGSRSIITRSSARGWRASGSRRCATPTTSSTRSAQLVFLHLRFYGYRSSEWTDSAVRRYVVDAGPLLDAPAQARPLRLHDPQQAQGGRAVGRLRHARAAHRDPARAGGAGPHPARPRRQRDHGDPRHPARAAGGRGLPAPAWRCGWTAARSATSEPSPNCSGGTPRTR